MKAVHHQANRTYQVIVAIINLIILIGGLWSIPNAQANWGIILLVAILTGCLIQFPTKILREEINLIPVIALGGGFMVGPVPAAWATALGILGGYMVRWFAREKRSWRRYLHSNTWIKLGFKIGSLTLPLMISFFALGWQVGILSKPVESIWLVTTSISLIFVLLHGLLITGNFLFQQHPSSYPNFRKELGTFGSIEAFTALFTVLIIESYWQTGAPVLILFGGIPLVAAILLHRVNSTQIDYERRVRELSTIQHISQTLRSTLDLDELLPVIQEQVMQLLEVNNFYVALYDREHEELWYPFAVKFGQQQHWPRRSISNRLTERVIQEEKPIILTPETQPILAPVGLPSSEANPSSWLGVPLISSERIIGCLAVFSLDPSLSFTAADTDVLTLLSGQVSVAIENALLYQQTQQRAGQLETLNQLTAAMTASLNLDEVLSQVCNSVSLVVDSQRSAIFLTDPGGDTVSLAHSHGLGKTFKAKNASFSIAQSRRARCLRTGKPNLITDLINSSLPVDLIQRFQSDEIQAIADFPLVTPDGKIGFLSVYFDNPHNFTPEETGILQTFASQAALAVANARLHARTDIALAQRVNQLTTLEAVGRELSAATHSEHLYTLILEYTLEMTNSCCGAVAIYNPATKNIEVRALQGYQISDKSFPFDRGITGRVARTGKIANVPNMLQDPDYLDMRQGDTRSQLSVPIIYENRILGVITVESTDFNAYSESEESFVTQLANQAAIDIINAELYQETQRRLREQSTLYQVSNHLVGAVSPDDVAAAITQAMNAILQALAIGVYHWSEASQSYALLGESGKHLPGQISQIENIYDQFSKTGFNPLAATNPLARLFSQGCGDCQLFVFPLEITRHPPGLVILHLQKEHILDESETKLIQAILAQGSIAFQNAYYFQEATNGRDRLAAILNSIEEGILMVDIDGHVLLANEPLRMLTGLPLEKFPQNPLQELPDEVLTSIGFNQIEIKSLLETLHQKHIPIMPKTVVEPHAAQSSHVIERYTTAVWGRDGQVIGWMLLLRDITEAREIEQAREAITETIVHDLRSPMSAIVSALELLSDCMNEPVDRENDDIIIRQSILVGQRSANRILDLTDALLEIARLQSGRMELTSQAIDMPQLISELLFEFTTRANNDNVIIRSKTTDELPLVWADRNKLSRVLTNLVDNAIKFTPQGGQVTISVEQISDDFIAVKVQDSGPGIPDEYRERIFERFVQVPGQRSKRRGTGLGLTFCRLAVEAHGGRIWVDSHPKGGSIFTFTLPITSPGRESTD